MERREVFSLQFTVYSLRFTVYGLQFIVYGLQIFREILASLADSL